MQREREGERGWVCRILGGQCNEIGAQPEVTYPAGCGRSGTYVTNIQSVHAAYQGLCTTTTKPTSHESYPTGRRLRNPSASGFEKPEFRVGMCSSLIPSSYIDHRALKLPND